MNAVATWCLGSGVSRKSLWEPQNHNKSSCRQVSIAFNNQKSVIAKTKSQQNTFTFAQKQIKTGLL